MPATIYTIIKEFYADIHGHAIKARIMSPVQDDSTFIFQVNLYYKSKSDAEAHEPASKFTSYANAERHLLQYLEGFQNTLDLGGDVARGANF